MSSESIRTVIRTRRESLGLSRTDATRRTGCYAGDWSRIENGRIRAWPALRQRVAELLGCDVSSLFDSTGWPLVETP